MSFITGGLRHSARGALKWFLGNATHMSKLVMLRLAIVPPPFRIGIDVTDRCNFRCPTCYKWRTSHPAQELGFHEWQTIFDKIAGIPLLHEIAISGGEPFTRSDIFRILELAKRQGLRIVLISNGWFLDENILRQLEETGVDRLMISLNSLKESVHDASRATPGSYSRIMHLIETWCAQPRITDLCLLTIIMESNCGELSALAEFVQAKKLSGIAFQALLPTEVHYSFASESCMPESRPDWYMDDPRWVTSVDTLCQQIGVLLHLLRQGYPILNPSSQLRDFVLYFESPEAFRTRPCIGTLARMHIDPLGYIRLCHGYPPIGNILHDDPHQVWRSESAQQIRKASRKCTRLCRIQNSNL